VWKHLHPGERPRAKRLNDAAQMAERRVTGAGGAVVSSQPGGLVIDVRQAVTLSARVTGASGAAHAWTEVYPVAGTPGTWADLSDGRTGTTTVLPALERNGQTVATGTRVWLELDPCGEFYLFDGPPAGGSTVPSGSTFTLASGSTFVMAGPTWNITSTTTATISSGQSLIIAGPGTFSITAPVVLGGPVFRTHQTITPGVVVITSLAVPTANLVRLVTESPFSVLAGVVASVSGSSGTEFSLYNPGPGVLYVTNEDPAESTATRRILTPDGATFAIVAGDRGEVWYDPTSSRYRVTGSCCGEEYLADAAVSGSGAASFTPTFTGGGTGTAGDPPPCGHGETYTVVVAGATGTPFDPNGSYALVYDSAEIWRGTAGAGVTGTLDLTPSPVTLSFTRGGMAGNYECASFSCSTGGTFTFVSQADTGTWPASLTVTNP
jgi:hypothetical protein